MARFNRLRRLRRDRSTRELFKETGLKVRDLIMPYFVVEGRNKSEPIKSMPGIYRLSIDRLIDDVEEAKETGIRAILLFGVSDKKDLKGSHSYSENGIPQKAVRAIKRRVKDIIVITDVCLCGYTTHGHCGIVKSRKSVVDSPQKKIKNSNHGPWTMDHGIIDNDETIKILAKIALSHAGAGADFVAPSAMMDGQVKTIREALDKTSFGGVGILAYSAKYASSFYWPFREALDSSPRFGDRKSYQMDYANSDEALREMREDIEEGADIVMVKPALAYLDIIYRAKEKFGIPIAAYNVSGEYALIKRKALQDKREIEDTEKNLILEILTGIKRAGADLIITYHAKEVAGWLKH